MFYCGFGPDPDIENNYGTANTSTPIIPVRAFMNRKIVLKRVELYGGVSAGYVFTAHDQTFIPSPDISSPHHRGYSAGFQAGATWYVANHLGINVEGQANYVRLINPVVSSYTFSYPVTAGIRYRF